jgi:L-arabinokinase
LLERARTELAAEFNFARPMRVSRAPGRLDIMGGIADYTGSLVCEMPLDRAAAVLLQQRADRDVQIFSFNLLDEHQPFTFRMPLAGLASATADQIRDELEQPGRKWAGYLVGCLFVLHQHKRIDLNDPNLRGLNLALLSTVPLGAGVSSSAAIEVATMMNLVDHFGIARRAHVFPPLPQGEGRGEGLNAMQLAAMCQQVENRIVGAPCGIMDQVTSCAGTAGSLLRLLCQPHELRPPLKFPDGIRAIGINSNVKHSVGGGQYGRTRCAAFMAHAMILTKMREMGTAGGKTLDRDPMNGYLANLDPDEYKRFFRSYLPAFMPGREFLDRFGNSIDTATTVQPNENYPVQHAADHHVLEAMRVRNFVEFLEAAGGLAPGSERSKLLNKAGHLMYASHLSYTNDAMLGADECDVLVDLVKQRERAGLYGAKITGGGSGGTVAVLCNADEHADTAIAQIMSEYERQTGRRPEAFTGTSPGAWEAGTALIGKKVNETQAC